MLATILLFLLGANWTYHAVNKPTEIFFPLDHSLDKLPSETWKQYGSLFRKHATPVVTPELLAALAQVEGGGNPVARTYWRWHLTWNPLEVYRPASSAVGMYQITDGTFQEATRYCIHNHRVVEDGPWHNPNSCWFNSLYSRVVPSHAIQLTSAEQQEAAVVDAMHQARGKKAGFSLSSPNISMGDKLAYVDTVKQSLAPVLNANDMAFLEQHLKEVAGKTMTLQTLNDLHKRAEDMKSKASNPPAPPR